MKNNKQTAVEWLKENLHLAKDPFGQALKMEEDKLAEKDKEIDILKEQIVSIFKNANDEIERFAIRFADWLDENEWRKVTHSGDGIIGYWMNDKMTNITDSALMQLYKQSLNQ